MTCHRAKRENILVQIEKGKGEMGNRGKKERNCSITPDSKSFNVLEITEWHLHVSTYECDSPCLASMLLHLLYICITYAEAFILCTYTHMRGRTHTHTERSMRIQMISLN